MYRSLRTRTVLLVQDETGAWQEASRRQDVFQLKAVTVWTRELLKGENGDYVAVSTPQASTGPDFRDFLDMGVDVVETSSHEMVHFYMTHEEMMEEWGSYF